MSISYQHLIDKAMHLVIKGALEHIAKSHDKILGKNSFFISFITNYPGVALSDNLRKKHPEQMTIVLQYQFEDLRLQDDIFTVTLYFDGLPETMTIPYNSITRYIDKEANFALNFQVSCDEKLQEEVEQVDSTVNLQKSDDSKVIFLDKFRNKKD